MQRLCEGDLLLLLVRVSVCRTVSSFSSADCSGTPESIMNRTKMIWYADGSFCQKLEMPNSFNATFMKIIPDCSATSATMHWEHCDTDCTTCPLPGAPIARAAYLSGITTFVGSTLGMFMSYWPSGVSNGMCLSTSVSFTSGIQGTTDSMVYSGTSPPFPEAGGINPCSIPPTTGTSLATMSVESGGSVTIKAGGSLTIG